MLIFNPKKLRKELIDIQNYFAKEFGLEGVIEDVPGIDGSKLDPNDYNLTISYDSVIQFVLPRQYEYTSIKCSELIELAEEMKSAQLKNNLYCITKNRFIVRLQTDDYNSTMKIDHILSSEIEEGLETGFSIPGSIGDCKYTVSLIKGITPFGILIAKEGDYDKQYPPVSDDLFIEIKYSSALNLKVLECITEAYIFELNASAELYLQTSPRASYPYFEEEEEYEIEPKLRPLDVSKGMGDVYLIFNNGCNTRDLDIALLIYTKIFEYVSQTVINIHKINSLQVKLYSKRALTPDANFIVELERTFEDLRKFKKDKEAIITTIATCCDAVELFNISPEFLKKRIKIDEWNEKQKLEFLKLFAEVLVDTRNSFAHAKVNYELTGSECPITDLPQFVLVVKLAATQVIRWFSALNENQRISQITW